MMTQWKNRLSFNEKSDLSRKENTAPLSQVLKQRSNSQQQQQQQQQQQRALLHNVAPSHKRAQSVDGNANDADNQFQKKRLSMSDVSDMLLEFYKTNGTKASKIQDAQISPKAAAEATTNMLNLLTKNLTADEMNAQQNATANSAVIKTTINNNNTESKNSILSSFHQNVTKNNNSQKITLKSIELKNSAMTAIPTSVLVAPITATPPMPQPQPQQQQQPDEEQDIKPLIHPGTGLVIPNPNTASVIKTVPNAAAAASAFAAALLRDNYHNLSINATSAPNVNLPTTKILENFLNEQQQKQQQQQQQQRLSDECDDTNSDAANDGDDEDDSRYNGFEDIHLIEGAAVNNTGIKTHFSANALTNLFNATGSPGGTTDYLSDESQKYMMAAQVQAHALRNLEMGLGEYGASSSHGGVGMGMNANGSFNDSNMDAVYECRHCGKKYRWKSTLRRHENVECGGKEPSHQCPYCPYKSKQRGNLGVHVRKHHSNLPQLTSKRRSKYSIKMEGESGGADGNGDMSSANISDESSSKLIIDCSK